MLSPCRSDSIDLCFKKADLTLVRLLLLLVSCLVCATPSTVAHQAPLSTGILQARILEWVAMPFSR